MLNIILIFRRGNKIRKGESGFATYTRDYSQLYRDLSRKDKNYNSIYGGNSVLDYSPTERTILERTSKQQNEEARKLYEDISDIILIAGDNITNSITLETLPDVSKKPKVKPRVKPKTPIKPKIYYHYNSDGTKTIRSDYKKDQYYTESDYDHGIANGYAPKGFWKDGKYIKVQTLPEVEVKYQKNNTLKTNQNNIDLSHLDYYAYARSKHNKLDNVYERNVKYIKKNGKLISNRNGYSTYKLGNRYLITNYLNTIIGYSPNGKHWYNVV